MAVLFSTQIFEDGCLICKIEWAGAHTSQNRDKVTEEQHTTPSIAEQLYSRVTLKKNTNTVKAVDVPDKAPRARIAALFLSPQLQNRLHSQAARHQFD
eukprot:scaffold13969_cov73-Skeletonema_dohrnii-CCMP3373.AAC.1